jgi:FkbH-like protein
MRFSEVRQNLRKDYSQFQSAKIAIVGDSPTQFLDQALMGCAYDRRLNPLLYDAGGDQIDGQILDAASDLYRFKPEYVVVFESTQRLLSHFYDQPREQQPAFAAAHLERVNARCRAVDSHLRAPLIYCNFAEIDDSVYGNYANKTRLSFSYQLRAINLGLMDLAANAPNLFVADVSALQNRAGRRNIVSMATYTTAGFAFALDFWPELAGRILDIIQSLRGRSHKAVVVDLDNTLWGGVVGDDGLENLQIGDLGVGKAFSELQAWLRQLKERGIILAVCSKNYESVAREVFDKHPDMILRLDDFAVFMANWENKVENIQHIQSVLNVGFDSIVYIDDSPFERAMVKQAIPSLTVPDLPEDPADYMEALSSLNLFETAGVSDADRARTLQYREEAERVQIQSGYDSEHAFLAGLQMVAEARPFDGFHVPRIAQLSQRSNQFNLRTVRYTERDVAAIMDSPLYLTRYFTLADRVGQYGLVSVVVLGKRVDSLFIENWFMSCRVLKRGMEELVLNVVMALARENGFARVLGEYVATSKNQLVEDHFPRLGFRRENGLWVADSDGYIERKTCITLR